MPTFLLDDGQTAPQEPDTVDHRLIHALLNTMHRSASRAELTAYLECFSTNAVFVGSDASEYWDMAQFAKICAEQFQQGKGWSYSPFERKMTIDPDGAVAWFYERLSNEKYGEARGSGVIVKQNGEWRIVQYVMSFPVPNDITDSVTAQITEFSKAK